MSAFGKDITQSPEYREGFFAAKRAMGMPEADIIRSWTAHLQSRMIGTHDRCPHCGYSQCARNQHG